MLSEEKSRISKGSPGKLELSDVKQLNKLYERFQAEYGFKLFESRRGSNDSNKSAEAKKVDFKDDSDHGTPDDEEEYLAIKRRKLKSKLQRKGSQSPKQGTPSKGGAPRTGTTNAKDPGQKVYVSPYSVSKTKPTAQVPGSLRSSKNSPSTSNSVATLSTEKKKISKRLKGMSLLRVRDQFQPAEDDDATDEDDLEEEMPPEVTDFRDNTHSHSKSHLHKYGPTPTLANIQTLNNINTPNHSKNFSDKRLSDKRGADKKR